LIRGICCLRPGVPGVSERIRVTSIVDRFLEHSRVVAFGAGDRTEVFISSADWMPRNFVRRIEALIPIEEPALARRLLDEVLGLGLRDNVKRRSLGADGVYTRVPAEEPLVRSQAMQLDCARGVGAAPSEPEPPRLRHSGAIPIQAAG
jgi:polyphosphate kinase